MSDYNLTCITCTHGPHKNAKCKDCDCRSFARADVAIPRMISVLANNQAQAAQDHTFLLETLIDLIGEIHPEAYERLKDKRQKMAEEAQRVHDEELARREAEVEAQNRADLESMPELSEVINGNFPQSE